MILATVRYSLSFLKELVRAGADLNLQNQVTVQPNSTMENLPLTYTVEPLNKGHLPVWKISLK